MSEKKKRKSLEPDFPPATPIEDFGPGRDATFERFDDDRTIEEQAELQELHGVLGGALDASWGHLKKATARYRSSGQKRLVVPKSIRDEMVLLKNQADQVIEAVDRIWR